MGPNAHPLLVLPQEESEDDSWSSQINVLENLKSDTSARDLWQQRLRGVPCSNLSEYDNPLLRAIESIHVVNPEESHCSLFLQKFSGKAYSVDHQILEQIRSQAPRCFTAKVADFNDNLAYDMPSQRGLMHLGVDHDRLECLEGRTTDCDVQGSYLSTETTIPQPAHVDYDWQVLQSLGQHLYIGFFPLTKEGMFLQVWPSREKEEEPTVSGQIVYVPFGSLLVLPATTIHGGGFRTTSRLSTIAGNLRFHLYIAQNGIHLPQHQTNKYTEPSNPARLLEERYIDSPHLNMLRDHLFV